MKDEQNANASEHPLDLLVIHKKPEKNAVIVELVNDAFVVSIECKDSDRECLLKDMAKDILQACV